jgi:ribosomal protein S3AE
MSQKQAIKKIIRCISEKNYAEADKYLKLVVTEKMKSRIRKAIATQNIF